MSTVMQALDGDAHTMQVLLEPYTLRRRLPACMDCMYGRTGNDLEVQTLQAMCKALAMLFRSNPQLHYNFADEECFGEFSWPQMSASIREVRHAAWQHVTAFSMAQAGCGLWATSSQVHTCPAELVTLHHAFLPYVPSTH